MRRADRAKDDPSSERRKALSEEDRRKRIAEFRASCRVYRKEKEQILEMEAAFPHLKSRTAWDDPSRNQQYRYYRMLKNEVREVEATMNRVETLCGSNARLLIYELFINQKTRTEVAEEYGLTCRQLSYSVDKWMRTVFQ